MLAGALLTCFLGLSINQTVLLMGLVFAVGLAIVGGQLNLPSMASALFPMRVRATGVGTTMAIGRAESIVGPAVGGVLVDRGLVWWQLFGIASVPSFVAGVAILIAAGYPSVSQQQKQT